MKVIHLCFNVIGRFLMSLVFLAGGVNKILHWHENERFLLNTLCEWQSNVGFSENLNDYCNALIPWTPFLLLLATLIEILGGLSILLGYKEKIGATFLALFLIPTTVIMHQFWFVDGNLRELQLVHFLKNLAILGGLILFILAEENPSKDSFSKDLYR
jgi:putative oxidoreductase